MVLIYLARRGLAAAKIGVLFSVVGRLAATMSPDRRLRATQTVIGVAVRLSARLVPYWLHRLCRRYGVSSDRSGLHDRECGHNRHQPVRGAARQAR